MSGRRAAFVVAWALASASGAAGAAEFPGVPDLRERLAAFHIDAAALQAASRHPHAEGPARGIDLSHYQGDVRWDELKGRGLSFAYIKATEGDDVVDPRFARNWQGAADAGLLRGAYHFYNFCKPGLGQAENLLRTVSWDPLALPVTVDLEVSGDCGRMPAKEDFLRELDAFSRRVEAATGKEPILYVEHRVYDKYLTAGLVRNKVWISDFEGSPALSDGRYWTLWQYSEKGRVAGIRPDVDLDVFYGGAAELTGLSAPPEGLLSADGQTGVAPAPPLR